MQRVEWCLVDDIRIGSRCKANGRYGSQVVSKKKHSVPKLIMKGNHTNEKQDQETSADEVKRR